MRITKKFALLAGLLIGLIGSGYLFFKWSHAAPQGVSASFVTDFSDDRRLVGFMDHVFLGRVVAQNTTLISSDYPLPTTEFTVQVIDSIKGDLSGEIVVRQDGGLDPTTNEMVLVYGDALLEVNGVYLLATKTCDDGSCQQAGAVYGTIKVEPSSSAPEIVARFEAAFANEIPYIP